MDHDFVSTLQPRVGQPLNDAIAGQGYPYTFSMGERFGATRGDCLDWIMAFRGVDLLPSGGSDLSSRFLGRSVAREVVQDLAAMVLHHAPLLRHGLNQGSVAVEPTRLVWLVRFLGFSTDMHTRLYSYTPYAHCIHIDANYILDM